MEQYPSAHTIQYMWITWFIHTISQTPSNKFLPIQLTTKLKSGLTAIESGIYYFFIKKNYTSVRTSKGN